MQYVFVWLFLWLWYCLPLLQRLLSSLSLESWKLVLSSSSSSSGSGACLAVKGASGGTEVYFVFSGMLIRKLCCIWGTGNPKTFCALCVLLRGLDLDLVSSVCIPNNCSFGCRRLKSYITFSSSWIFSCFFLIRFYSYAFSFHAWFLLFFHWAWSLRIYSAFCIQ